MPGRVKCGGTEEDIVVAHACRKRKKLICGPEEEIVVAHGRLPSPAPMTTVLSRIKVRLLTIRNKQQKPRFEGSPVDNVFTVKLGT